MRNPGLAREVSRSAKVNCAYFRYDSYRVEIKFLYIYRFAAVLSIDTLVP